jgi:3-oxoacyl-[acyl-carrier protein] reductase
MAAAGHDVVLTYSSDPESAARVRDEIEELGRSALVVAADVADSASADACVDAAMRRFGRVDVLVNNAAIRPRRPLLEVTDDDWSRVVGVNLSGPFYLSRSCAPHMMKQGSGCLIHISGLAAFLGGGGGAVHIAASKAGLSGLSRALADELGPYGIRSNVIVPARMGTTRGEPVDPAKVEAEIRATPMARIGTVQDVAGLCVYLASAQASFVSGQMIHVNGGYFKT